MKKDMEDLAESVFISMKAYCDCEVDRKVALRVDALLTGFDDRIKAMAPKDGRDGADGKDGIDGKDGAPGIDGKDGAPGIDGKDGVDGVNGKDGADGLHGKDGAPGIDGRDGLQGKDGEPGRDAAHIEIAQVIDQERSYPRGMFAKHAGGLWRSFEKTEGLRGWECVVEGIAGVEDLGGSDPRTFGARIRTSTGAVEIVRHVPAMIYQKVWQEGRTYEPGDTSTWRGSLWHCDEPTQDKPGEPNSKGWTMAAKRGRDGMDGAKGERGERGLTGRAGKDLTQLGFDGSKT